MRGSAARDSVACLVSAAGKGSSSLEEKLGKEGMQEGKKRESEGEKKRKRTTSLPSSLCIVPYLVEESSSVCFLSVTRFLMCLDPFLFFPLHARMHRRSGV